MNGSLLEKWVFISDDKGSTPWTLWSGIDLKHVRNLSPDPGLNDRTDGALEMMKLYTEAHQKVANHLKNTEA